MGRLFGTDGVRGVANHDLTCELAMKLGRAAAAVLINKSNRHPRVIIGKDTRLSSDMLENAMAAGLCSVGIGRSAGRCAYSGCGVPCGKIQGRRRCDDLCITQLLRV